MKMEQAEGHHKYQNFQFKCGLFISAIAVIALFGWSFNITYFKSFASGFIGMNPMIALNFIAFGIWLLARKNHTTPVFNLTVLVVLINSFIVIPKIVALFYPQSFQVDTLLFAQLTKANKIPPATAFNFFLLNIAFLISFSKHKSKEFIYQALVIFCLGVSAIYLLSYLFNFNSLIGVSALTPMALNTCICLSRQGLHETPNGKKIRWLNVSENFTFSDDHTYNYWCITHLWPASKSVQYRARSGYSRSCSCLIILHFIVLFC